MAWVRCSAWRSIQLEHPWCFGPDKVFVAVTLCCPFLAQRARIALPLLAWMQELCWVCMVGAHHVGLVSLGCLGLLLSQFNFLQPSELCIILCFPSSHLKPGKLQ